MWVFQMFPFSLASDRFSCRHLRRLNDGKVAFAITSMYLGLGMNAEKEVYRN